jgi:uncharacterized protein DUF6516
LLEEHGTAHHDREQIQPVVGRQILDPRVEGRGTPSFQSHIISGYEISKDVSEHALEFLLAFDGRIHHLEQGYWLKFEIKRVPPTEERPHGLTYAFTLHAPSGKRLIGFDNAHKPPARGSKFKQQPAAGDHWHRTASDVGRPYAFAGVEKLLDEFFDEVERVLQDHGIGTGVIGVADKGDQR